MASARRQLAELESLKVLNKAGGGWSRAPRASASPLMAEKHIPAAGGNANARPAAPGSFIWQANRLAATAKPATAAKPAAVAPRRPSAKPAVAAVPKPVAPKTAAAPHPAAPTTSSPPSTSSCGSASSTPSASTSSSSSSSASSASASPSTTPLSYRAAASSSTPGGIVAPALDLNRPHTAVTPLKKAEYVWDSGVWGLQYGSERYVVKSSPFYSPGHAARVRTLSLGRARAPVLVTQKQAMHEVNVAREMAAAAAVAQAEGACSSSVGDIYVQPLRVFTRACSRTFAGPKGNKSACPAAMAPDREVVAVYPFVSSGDAVHHMFNESRRLMAGLSSGALSLDEVVGSLVELLTGMTRDMLALVSTAHLLGYVLCDHKLENMVYDSVKGRWQLIDAAEVARCRLGETYMGACRRTPFFESPEQRAGAGSDSRSDVYACGRAVQMAVSD